MQLVHTEEVTGSIPVSPTRSAAGSEHGNRPSCFFCNTEAQQRCSAAQPRSSHNGGVLWPDNGLVFTTAPVITVGAEAMDKIFANEH